MKCTNCGTEIEEGSLFCTGCGRKVADMAAEEQGTVNPQPQQQASEPVATGDPQKKNYRLVGIIAVVVIAVVAVLIFALLTRGGSSDSSNEKKLVYDQDGILYYVPNMDKDADPVEIDEVRDDNSWEYEFSPSGKYLYYHAYDDRSMLCRVELAKLKADSNKNSNYIEEIDAKVNSYVLMDDERVLYCDFDSTLYYYDGSEESKIDDDVMDYSFTDDTVYYTIYDDDDMASFYYYDTAKNDGDCIVDGEDIISTDYDTGSCYVQDGDEIYEVSKNGDETRVLNGVDWVADASVKNHRIYFVRQRSIEKTLYDFVEDDYADEDAAIGGEPDVNDYLEEVSEKTALTRQANAFLAEFPEDRYMYLDEHTSWSDVPDMVSYYNSDDEETYYFDAAPEKWYRCDWDSYYADESAYEDAQNREELRSELKGTDYTQTYEDLYVWNQGSDEQELVTSIDSSILDIDNDHQILYYRKIAEDDTAQANKISIDSVYSTDAVYEWLGGYGDEDYDEADAEDGSDETWYVMTGTKEQEMDIPIWGIHVSDNGKTAIVWSDEDDENVLYDYDVTSDGLKEVGKVTEDAYVYRGAWVGDSYYYMTGEEDYGDLNVYKNHKSTTLAKNVALYQVNVFDDGNTAAYKDTDKMELRIYGSNGDDTTIGKDIDSYAYINANRIVYKKNDNLYVYTGKDEDRRIVRGMGDSGDYLCFSKIAEF